MISAIFVVGVLPSLISTQNSDAIRHAALAYYKYEKLDVRAKELEERHLTTGQRHFMATATVLYNISQKKYITYTWSF